MVLEPNFNILLYYILISFFLRSICLMILGISGKEKETHFDIADTIIGFLNIIICIIICII